jgi:Tfp pilus assembly protein PilF
MSSELSNSPDIYFLRGIIYLYNDNIDRAKKMFTEGLRFDPDDEKCHNALKNVKKLEHLKEKGIF